VWQRFINLAMACFSSAMSPYRNPCPISRKPSILFPMIERKNCRLGLASSAKTIKRCFYAFCNFHSICTAANDIFGSHLGRFPGLFLPVGGGVAWLGEAECRVKAGGGSDLVPDAAVDDQEVIPVEPA
jgi:hypothetical protein